MTAEALLTRLRRTGFRLTPMPEGIRVSPARALTDADRDLIRSHREALMALLSANPPEVAELERAIHGACDLRGDTEANRRALIEDARAAPPELRADLVAHFEDVARMYRALLRQVPAA